MIYQETYQAGGDPTKLNISGVLYTHNLSTFLPPRCRNVTVSRHIVTPSMKWIIQ